MELEVGAIVEGKVTGITKFGAFVALPGGRSGLVHISEVAYTYVNEVSDFLAVGQDVTVKIIGIDESNRINLSIKQTLPPPPRNDRPGRGPRPGGGARPDRRETRPPAGGGRPGGHDNRNGRPRQGGARSGQGGYGKGAGREPSSFDDMLKQFMSDSESKQSELNRGERGGRGRRGGRRSGGGGGGSDYDY